MAMLVFNMANEEQAAQIKAEHSLHAGTWRVLGYGSDGWQYKAPRQRESPLCKIGAAVVCKFIAVPWLWASC